jgi:leucyl-tRNA synthetase
VDYQQSAKEFEARWQKYWAEHDIYKTPNPGDVDFDPSRDKFVILDFFPYPSGIGLHIGHPLGYIATDVKARFLRMRNFNVLYAMGFDAFGLPAEQYALQTGQHPSITTENNISNMLNQLTLLGLGHDPHRRFSTTDPDYYRWTQWIFLRLFNSYYDPEERWTGPDGHSNVGRARPIEMLIERLRAGEWRLNEEGTPVPQSQSPDGRIPSAEQMDAALDRARLAYLDEVPVNWCPMLGTVLSNEEVTNEGKSERGNYPVYKRPLNQWVLRITKYADRLLNDLVDLKWPKGIVQMQMDWIGQSQGAQIKFPVTDAKGVETFIKVFTTRPDTLFGATFITLAPEHPLVPLITTPERLDAVKSYQEEASRLKTVREQDENAKKTGVFTGAYAFNPASGEKLPVWISDFVLMTYGTGAIMSVPAHDSRDFEFAQTFGLRVKVVVEPTDEWLAAHAPATVAQASPSELKALYMEQPEAFNAAFSEEGIAVNSTSENISIDGLPMAEAITKIAEWLEARGYGQSRVQYKLRDWLFSRQRYWGEPFPIVFDEETGRAHRLADCELPVRLPDLQDFEPVTSKSPDSLPSPPLARAIDWMHVTGVILDDGSVRLIASAEAENGGAVIGDKRYQLRRFRRDTNTMPNWAGSCWYYLRYFDPHNEKAFVGWDAETYWSLQKLPDGRIQPGAVDLYVGGAEHAVLHLLYARFWHKALYDLGYLSTREPFYQLFNQGMITADAYRDERGVYVDVHDVVIREENEKRVPYNRETGERLITDPGKMGKRYKNGIPPEEVCLQYSTDTFRTYEMFMGPLEASKPWQSEAIIGLLRFLRNVWRLALNKDGNARDEQIDPEVDRLVHKTIKKVTGDIEGLRLNTAIAALMELSNALAKQTAVHESHVRTLVLLLSPFAPHLAEELISNLYPAEHQAKKSVIHFEWPTYDAEKVKDEELEVPVQVNGKRRSSIVVPVNITKEELETLALEDEAVRRHIDGKNVRRVVVVMKPRPQVINLVID